MADEAGKFNIPLDDSTGSRDRATVALVYAELKNVTTLVQGHRDLTVLGFENVQRQLDSVSFLPAEFAKLKQDVRVLRERVDEMENSMRGRLEYRRVNLPVIVIGAVAALVSILELVIQFH